MGTPRCSCSSRNNRQTAATSVVPPCLPLIRPREAWPRLRRFCLGRQRVERISGALAGLARGLHRIAAAAANQCGVLSDRQGFADKITLHRVAALVREERELLLG